MNRALAPLIVLVVGFGFSLAGNMLWTWPGGPVRVLGGAFASIALPAAIHLFPHVPVVEWWARLLRNLVMTCIGLLAAGTTFVHASNLLVAHGEELWLARAYPVMSELLVVFAVLTLRVPVKAKRKTLVQPSRRVSATHLDAAAPPAPATEIDSHRGQRAEMVAWATSLEQLPPIKDVQRKFGVSTSTAKRVRNAARAAS